jgi:exodeoxyribonuclease VII large subunit
MDTSLKRNINYVYEYKANRFDTLKNALNALSPLLLMDKGYAMIKKEQKVLTTINDVKINDDIEIELQDGYIYTNVKGKKEK